MKMTLEICANSFQSAKNAQLAGADRIELCQELSLGGLTPSYGLLKMVLSQIDIETFVLIRPRSGSFCYSDYEFEIMKENIKMSKNLGCHGIVSGVLLKDHRIDIERLKTLVELSKPLPFTFHRAFDCVPDPLEALDTLINLNINRVLTSGQKLKAENGLPLLLELQKKAKDSIIIMPGSGINSNHITQFKATNFKELHASASVQLQNTKTSAIYDSPQTVSDLKKIKSLLKQMQ